jgi:PleD family two-component response regulator
MADRMLYRAKSAGRDQLGVAGKEGLRSRR